ncbi:Tomoregulin-1 [Acipenser ruthenus]|uniref:Tomoregulin-1 n=1 Tax=Acipenser ruthenus TaxID=7906 RepID=A0A444UMT1_ACIRT|nr:Tomoregulin-1 [Acipenser ruthenus]
MKDNGSGSGEGEYEGSGADVNRKFTKCGTCKYGAECDEDSEDVWCICNIDCSGHNENPVCATDGDSYKNPCLVREASCLKQEQIDVKHLGKCPGWPQRRCKPLATATLDPPAVQTLDPLAVQTLDPLAVQTLDPLAVQTLDPLAVQTLDPVDVQTLDPVDVQTLDPLDVQTLDPVDVWLAFTGFAGEQWQSCRPHPATSAAIPCVADALYKVFDVDKLGLNHFPSVEASIAALVQTAVCPIKQCWVTEVILKKAYAASAFSARLGNYNSILVAYQAHLVRSFTDLGPSVQQLDELRFISRTLLQLSKLSAQAVGRNLAALLAARRKLWLSQACVSEGDTTTLLDAPVTPGRTFGPALDDMLQHSHRTRESTKGLE